MILEWWGNIFLLNISMTGFTPYKPVSDEARAIVPPTQSTKVIGSWHYWEPSPSLYWHFPNLHPIPALRIPADLRETHKTFDLALQMSQAMIEILGPGHIISMELHKDSSGSEVPQQPTWSTWVVQKKESLILSILGPSNKPNRTSIPVPSNIDHAVMFQIFLRVMDNFKKVSELMEWRVEIQGKNPPTIQ